MSKLLTLIDELGSDVREYLTEFVRDVSQKLSEFDKRIREIPAGPQGDRGAVGEKGEPGQRGECGERGDIGLPGSQGAKGDQGPKGDPGERGISGERGESGTRGESGPTGQKGDQGIRGEQGERGLPGESIRGEKGEPGIGERGEIGKDGSVGLHGITGERGPAGERGNDGAAGERGEPGFTGPSGPKGEPGLIGERGEKGERGETGQRGELGPMAPQGVPGERGERGEAGITGRDGHDGRHASEIEIVKSPFENRKYSRGTLGVVNRALCWSNGDSWEELIPPPPYIVEEKPEKLPGSRVTTRTQKWSDGRPPVVYSIRSDEQIYRNVWAAGVEYERGDTVTHDGTLWHCQAGKTRARPKTSGDWKLCRKRDGKAVENGDKDNLSQELLARVALLESKQPTNNETTDEIVPTQPANPTLALTIEQAPTKRTKKSGKVERQPDGSMKFVVEEEKVSEDEDGS